MAKIGIHFPTNTQSNKYVFIQVINSLIQIIGNKVYINVIIIK